MGGLNTYGYVDANPLTYIDPFGLDRLPPSHALSFPDYNTQNYYTARAKHGFKSGPGLDLSSMYGAEGHFLIGGGLAAVNCVDECGQERTFRYLKVCGGGAMGISGGAGIVTGMDGKNCRSDNYKGYFYEIGGAIGYLSAGADIGYTNGGAGGLPDGLSGVNEYHGGPGTKWGVQFKSSWCYYFPLQ